MDHRFSPMRDKPLRPVIRFNGNVPATLGLAPGSFGGMPRQRINAYALITRTTYHLSCNQVQLNAC
jgi:hypothetical protein